jgi:hypothetical protein
LSTLPKFIFEASIKASCSNVFNKFLRLLGETALAGLDVSAKGFLATLEMTRCRIEGGVKMMAAEPPSFNPHRLFKRDCHFERSEKSHVICSELAFLFERLNSSADT